MFNPVIISLAYIGIVALIVYKKMQRGLEEKKVLKKLQKYRTEQARWHTMAGATKIVTTDCQYGIYSQGRATPIFVGSYSQCYFYSMNMSYHHAISILPTDPQ